MVVLFKDLQTRLSRGRRSRNKVSVGEPAEGSLSAIGTYICLHISTELQKYISICVTYSVIITIFFLHYLFSDDIVKRSHINILCQR